MCQAQVARMQSEPQRVGACCGCAGGPAVGVRGVPLTNRAMCFL